MEQAQLPLFPVNEKTMWSDLPQLFETYALHYEERTGQPPPLLIFEPVAASKIPAFKMKVSEAPEELMIACIAPFFRDAIFDALKRVEAREPKIGDANAKLPKIKDNTPLKSIYRQMGEMPATVFSVTFPLDDGENGTIFFLRTPFTVSEFRREVEKPLI